MAAAVLTVAALAFLLPDDFRALPGWIFQLLLLVFLVVLVIGDPDASTATVAGCTSRRT